MKKIILITGLIMLSLTGKVCAQRGEEVPAEWKTQPSKTEKTFNILGIQTNIKDIVQLHNGKMILDLQNVGDYESFRNLNSILMNFRKDIAFYKDSLEANSPGHVKIDYVMSPEYTFKKIRFKKYQADGDIFVSRHGDVSKLKLEQDTVHIIIEKLLYKSKCTLPYSISVTFLLDNYTDLDKAFADTAEMHRIIETLEKASHSKKTDKPNSYPQFTIVYNPYFTGDNNLKKTKGVSESERPLSFIHENDYIQFVTNFGAGVVMNTLSPTAELGLSLNSPKRRHASDFSFCKAFVSSYYFFERNSEGNLSVKDNWFVNIAAGNYFEKGDAGWPSKISDLGVGYLFAQKGNYFKNTTMRVFTDIRLTNGLTLTPEIIGTNNFKQFFPGITIKVF